MRYLICCLILLFSYASFAQNQPKKPKGLKKIKPAPLRYKGVQKKIIEIAPASLNVPIEGANHIKIEAGSQTEYLKNQLDLIKGNSDQGQLLKQAQELLEKSLLEQDIQQSREKIIQQQNQQSQERKAVETVNKMVFMANNVSPSELEFRKGILTGPTQFDSRIEPITLDSTVAWQKKILKNTESIGIVIEKDKIHDIADDWVQLDISSTLKTRYKLCQDEAFSNQPVIGIGTAFIVGEKKMVTASHVLTGPLENYVIVFGFQMINRNGIFKTLIPKANIYHPKKIIYKDDDVDMTVFEVKEKLTQAPLTISKTTTHAVHTEIYMIGYPTGLPQKLALNADIQENHMQFFYTSLDAFQGNSGSPVFNLLSHEVIGVLVSGEVDYIWNGSCNKTALCRFPYCKGEKVMKISSIQDYLDKQIK